MRAGLNSWATLEAVLALKSTRGRHRMQSPRRSTAFPSRRFNTVAAGVQALPHPLASQQGMTGIVTQEDLWLDVRVVRHWREAVDVVGIVGMRSRLVCPHRGHFRTEFGTAAIGMGVIASSYGPNRMLDAVDGVVGQLVQAHEVWIFWRLKRHLVIPG